MDPRGESEAGAIEQRDPLRPAFSQTGAPSLRAAVVLIAAASAKQLSAPAEPQRRSRPITSVGETGAALMLRQGLRARSRLSSALMLGTTRDSARPDCRILEMLKYARRPEAANRPRARPRFAAGGRARRPRGRRDRYRRGAATLDSTRGGWRRRHSVSDAHLSAGADSLGMHGLRGRRRRWRREMPSRLSRALAPRRSTHGGAASPARSTCLGGCSRDPGCRRSRADARDLWPRRCGAHACGGRALARRGVQLGSVLVPCRCRHPRHEILTFVPER